MNTEQLGTVINYTKSRCKDKGINLTLKRQRVWEILLNSDKPLSAYEITDVFNLHFSASIMAMSVYRILEFLESANLVYHLHSANKYIANRKPGDPPEAPAILFLICKNCQQVTQNSLPEPCREVLTSHIENARFDTRHAHLEVNTICSECADDSISS